MLEPRKAPAPSKPLPAYRGGGVGTGIPVQNILLRAANRNNYFPNPDTGFSEGSEITQGSSIFTRTFHSNGNILYLHCPMHKAPATCGYGATER